MLSSRLKLKPQRFLSVLLFLTIFSFNASAQDSTKVKRISERLDLLEAYNKEILDKKFDTKSTELTNKIDYEVKKAADDVQDQLKIIKITGGIIGFLLAAGIGILLYQYFVNLKKKVDKLFKEKIENHLNENSQFLIDVITSQKVETQIKKNKKLLVLAGNDEEKNKVKTLLKAMGFDHIQIEVIQQFGNIPQSDLVIFSNTNKALSDDVISEFIKNSGDDDDFIFFGDRLVLDRADPNAEKVNFANSKYTLYHQIINTLSFKEVYKLETTP